jgi:hypothetical protein
MSDMAHLDVDSDEYRDAPKALREYVKKLKAANDELAQQVQASREQVASSALAGVLTGFKNPERVKRDLLADRIDPLNREALDAWLAENGDDYARADGTSQAQQQTDAEVQAHQRIQSAGSFKKPADMTPLEAAMSEITPDMTGAQIAEVYRKHGV